MKFLRQKIQQLILESSEDEAMVSSLNTLLDNDTYETWEQVYQFLETLPHLKKHPGLNIWSVTDEFGEILLQRMPFHIAAGGWKNQLLKQALLGNQGAEIDGFSPPDIHEESYTVSYFIRY